METVKKNRLGKVKEIVEQEINAKKTVELEDLIELESGYVLIMIKDISVKTESGIFKGEKQMQEEARTQHSEPVTVVLSHKDNKFKKGDKVFNLPEAKQQNVPLRFKETGEQTYYLITEDLIFAKRK